MPGPISQNGDFYSNNASPPKKSWCQISVKSVKRFGYKKRFYILQLPIPYCVRLIMVTITTQNFINIFQTVHFPAIKLTRGNEKNICFLLIPKSLKVWEKSEVIGPGSFNVVPGFEPIYIRFGKWWVSTLFTVEGWLSSMTWTYHNAIFRIYEGNKIIRNTIWR